MIVNDNARVVPYERASFFSMDGYEVEISSNYWKLNKDKAFTFDTLPEWLGQDIQSSFRQVLAIYGETSSAAYTQTLFYRLKEYFCSVSASSLFSPASIISYRDQLGKKDDWQLSSIRAFIRSWVSLGYPGIPAETLEMMEKWKIKGNEKGYAVQSMCPESGPLTDIEMQGIVSGVTEGYADGRLSLRDTCYAMILAMTGRRPIQITSLKLKDLIKAEGKYFINFPRAKQKSGSWRSSFKRFQIVEDLWMLLQSQAKAVRESFNEIVEDPIPALLEDELPLFPGPRQHEAKNNLEALLEGDELHALLVEVTQTMILVKFVIKVVSERTGGVTHLNPYRFRYTLGTNLAREGRGEYIIAEALDHSDIQNTGVYVKNIPDIVKHIDKAVALALAPIAQAFQGVLVTDETRARRGSDRASRICSSNGNVGTCGSYGFCGALAPIACYTCAHFQPWLDGPHEFVLDQLIGERDNVFASTGDLKIASVNDRLILAVSDVVARCKAVRSDFAHV
ncbi:site-specific integrase [Pseudomonas lundensis]|uniref:site-specific integrase n=1 Tax=Pseudomonas lundensis TaxID=86185 RepID=UPI001475F4BA|nr:site-specific integrase [Pseudomonas lundensis]NNA26928.1 site-specific integrase [Pseudomonas lundensis]